MSVKRILSVDYTSQNSLLCSDVWRTTVLHTSTQFDLCTFIHPDISSMTFLHLLLKHLYVRLQIILRRVYGKLGAYTFSHYKAWVRGHTIL